MSIYHTPIAFRNCTFVGNTSGDVGNCAWISNYCEPTFLNCLLWDEGDDGGGLHAKRFNDINSSGPVHIQYCAVRGGVNIPVDYAGVIENNVDIDDPEFEDPDNDDYSLSFQSPCIDEGTDVSAPDDDITGGGRPVGQGYDIGAYEFGASGKSGLYPGAVLYVR